MSLNLSAENLKTALRQTKEELSRRRTENKLAYYKAFAKQQAFHTAGKTCRERLMLASNQSGKSYCSAMEAALHATGRYPDDWAGYRFDRATNGWCCGESNAVVRDTVQKLLLGKPGEYGTGAIPKDALIDVVSARGLAELVDVIHVRHVSGGISTIGLKSYEAGREKFQGSTLDWCALDEEAPVSIYTEVLTRTNLISGPVWSTFTPLQGVSEIVRRFMYDKSRDRALITMTIDDCDLYTEEQKKQISDSYLPHEREARPRGVPILGSGRIFPVAEEKIKVPHRQIPSHWPRIAAMDFGFDHPFAAVELAHDKDHDTVYVIRAYRMKEQSVIQHASALRSWGKHLRWVFPQDGNRHTLDGAGISLADQYRAEGLEMMWEPARFEDGTNSVEAGLMLMLSRMQNGTFKVFDHLDDWFEEFRLFHRRDGKVFKEHDDLLAATRYGCMHLRFARTDTAAKSFQREIIYPKQRYM
jgi:phage terminase large subunit-like protein